MSYSIKAVRAKIIETLQPLRASLGVRTIAPYSGQFDDMADTNKLSIATVFPALFVSFASSAPAYFEEGEDKPNMRFTIICGAKNMSGNATCEDEATDLVDAVRPLLHNKYIGLNLSEPVTVERENLIAASASWAICGINLLVNFERPV